MFRQKLFDWRALSIFSFLIFLLLGIWQYTVFQFRRLDDYYEPKGYITRVQKMIEQSKIYYETVRTDDGFRPAINIRNFQPEDEFFYTKSWLKEDIEAFNAGEPDVFLIENGRIQSVNVYRHRIESPLAVDWSWTGKIYSQSSEGYAYLWNSRRTLKLYRAPLEQRASAKAGQVDFREVVYGRGHLFQTGTGISLKSRNRARVADVYALGDNIVLKSYGDCSINGHPVPKGNEQRLEHGDLVLINFDRNSREEFLFDDFSQKPLSFVNVVNGRLSRTNLDSSVQLVEATAKGIESSVKKLKPEKRANFDVHLALDEDLSGLTSVALKNFSRSISKSPVRASCTILNAIDGSVLSVASVTKKEEDINENLRLHPVGSATKIFLAAAAAHAYPDLLTLTIDPHPAGDERNLLGYRLKQGFKLREHSPRPGEGGYTDFATYIAKSCNRYHAVLMGLSLAKDSTAAMGKQQDLFHGISIAEENSIDRTNGDIYLQNDRFNGRPDLGYFLTARSDGVLECNNLETSELALNMQRFFEVERKFYEGSRQFFTPEPWNLLFARLGIAEKPQLYPAFFSIMPQSVNFGFNLNIDFRQDFISIIFGGATNRWNNVKLAEAMSRLVTNKKVQAHFVQKIEEKDRTLTEEPKLTALGLEEMVHSSLLRGMADVCRTGGTAWDLKPVLQALRQRTPGGDQLEFYAKTGTPFRKEIRKGEEELYSSLLLFTALLRDMESGTIRDGLTFTIYIEDQGEHKAIDFLKLILPKILAARRWISS